MHNNKRYTNATFTKRVDHEAGRHRAARSHVEPALCAGCGAVYADRRWVSAETARSTGKHRDWGSEQVILCPACKQERAGVPSGFVYLDGAFLDAHREDVEHLLKNEAKRASVDNPLSRIMSWGSVKSTGLTLTTTTEHLAKRLGQALEKAFSGAVRYDFSHENKLARVYWHRD